jgi:hypothetical protein
MLPARLVCDLLDLAQRRVASGPVGYLGGLIAQKRFCGEHRNRPIQRTSSDTPKHAQPVDGTIA